MNNHLTRTLFEARAFRHAQQNRDVDRDGKVDIALTTMFSSGFELAAGYEMQWEDSAGQTGSMRADTGRAWFKANTVRSYRSRWRTISWNQAAGPWSAWTGWVTPQPTAGAPAAPFNAFINNRRLGFNIAWNAPTEFDYAFTEIATPFSLGTPSDSQVVASRSVNYGDIYCDTTTGPRYVYVRHVNTSGLKSPWVLAGGGQVTSEEYGAVKVKSDNLGSNNSGSVQPGSTEDTLISFSWVCSSNTTGVEITLGNRTYSNVTFVNAQPMQLSHVQSGAGVVTVSKTGGGSWRSADLISVAQF